MNAEQEQKLLTTTTLDEFYRVARMEGLLPEPFEYRIKNWRDGCFGMSEVGLSAIAQKDEEEITLLGLTAAPLLAHLQGMAGMNDGLRAHSKELAIEAVEYAWAMFSRTRHLESRFMDHASSSAAQQIAEWELIDDRFQEQRRNLGSTRIPGHASGYPKEGHPSWEIMMRTRADKARDGNATQR